MTLYLQLLGQTLPTALLPSEALKLMDDTNRKAKRAPGTVRPCRTASAAVGLLLLLCNVCCCGHWSICK